MNNDLNYLQVDRLPAEAVKYNGKYLEEIIIGYTTLNVMGREALSLVIKSDGANSSYDGERFQGIRASSNNITVTYSLVAKDNTAFRRAYEILKRHLMKPRELVEISFNDEPEHVYFGIVSDLSEVDPGVNTVVGEIKLFFPDPYKYSDIFKIRGVGEVKFIPNGDTEPIRPVLALTLTANANKITVTNTKTARKIILNGSYSAGDIIRIDANKGIVTRNGIDIKSHLDFAQSDFFQFLLHPGDGLAAPGNIELSYRRKLL